MPLLDKQLGIEVYATKTLGLGGAIRKAVDDFIVEEVLVDGSRASIDGIVLGKVLGSTSQKQRYLLCVLVKRNWDTLIVIKNIAKQLGLDQNRIQIAGIKDAKAVTAQHITIDDCSIEESSRIEIKDVQIYCVGYVREALSTYYLLGNYFKIKVKEIKLKGSTVKRRISQKFEELEALGGIPNFFGHQRFGTSRPITHLVGKALVKGDFAEAAMLFLANPSVYEHQSSRQARQDLQTSGNFNQAFKNFPKQLRFERIMLSHLVDKSNDFAGAFRCLPVKLQELFVQAHQSFLFNRFLSQRIMQGYSLNRVEVGDYVVGVERSGLPITAIGKIATPENLAGLNEQIKVGKVLIALPLVGIRQKLPQGVMGNMEREVLEQEGVRLDCMRINELSRVGGKGGLRAAVAPVKDFKLQDLEPNENSSGCLMTLSFLLLRGSYATIVMREIMKPEDPLKAGF